MRSMPQGTEQAKKDGPAACADEDAHLLTLVKPDEHGDEHRMELAKTVAKLAEDGKLKKKAVKEGAPFLLVFALTLITGGLNYFVTGLDLLLMQANYLCF
ncbi:hypothetical protein Zm00014a_012591 [Zea mays]|uniref:Uncharacterized protein n=1 Tax=Zea mays TaxID=4577 RepID=A0A3L6EAL7_MAIZE|nr:hypothetical protein Zm00014a_012591 [Zea mays]PWZ16961.1 hypothetical protein Zm00014a_012591 [Zea mays]PWZ16962.1 hypothetical protein Zm00014a_012591 [Zea mays]PWZ16963.1 hypothetical protein Zm00014a_012591 [Zea mays]PWZ16964.1 hypothetical protein Zm00014a_012591 [Zea mays]